jgi:hypothetical protein
MDVVFKVRINKSDTFVDLHITRNQALCSIFLDQTRYVERLLIKYGYIDAHSVKVPANFNVRLSLNMDHNTLAATQQSFLYKNLLGSIPFVALDTHPDIAFTINNATRFAHWPTTSHCSALKKIVAYFKGTKEFGIYF